MEAATALSTAEVLQHIAEAEDRRIARGDPPLVLSACLHPRTTRVPDRYPARP